MLPPMPPISETSLSAAHYKRALSEYQRDARAIEGFSALVEEKLATKMDAGSNDAFWLMMCGCLVFFMQCGFALLEAGSVRSKNTKNILLKNLLDASIGAIIWYSVGFGMAYDGDDPYVGQFSTGPSLMLWWYVANEDSTGYFNALWFFQYVFAAAAATIVSGAVAERTQISGYILYTTFITMVIYPVVAHWVWSGSGWVSAFNSGSPYAGGVIDFAGSGVVHMTGGVAAFWGALIIGPRIGRFTKEPWLKKKPLPMPGHSTTLQVLGTFILWLGWYGFNPGSTLGISAPNYARDAARCVVTTTLAAATGGLVTVLVERASGGRKGVWSPSAVCNGILAGLVSITAGCVVVSTAMSVVVGAIGALIYVAASKCMLHVLKIDDPLDAFAVHGACGFWGVIAAGVFALPQYTYVGSAGSVYGGSDAMRAAILCLGAELAWVSGTSVLLFGLLKLLRLLRVSAEIEEAGMDISKHGGPAYEGVGGERPTGKVAPLVSPEGPERRQAW